MKIRQGFVSNSSSASFLIKTGPSDPLLNLAMEAIGQKPKTLSVYDIACIMLKACGKNRTLHELKKAKGDYDFIVFPTINEDTEIYRVEENPNVVYISTCNNEYTAWTEAMEKIKEFGVEEIIESDSAYDFPCFKDDEHKRVMRITEWEDSDES